MKLNSKLFLILFLILLSFIPSSSQSSDSSNVNAASSRQQPADADVRAETVSGLQMQLEIMRQYDDKIFSTIYWSLSFAGGVVLLVLGLGWYTNFRIYKNDLAEIRRELEAELKKIETSVKQAATTTANIAAATAISDIELRIKKLSHDMLNSEADRHLQAKVWRNAIITYLQMTELANEISYDFLIARDLKKISEIFRLNSVNLGAEDTATLMKTLDLVSKTFQTDVDLIKEQVKNDRRKALNLE